MAPQQPNRPNPYTSPTTPKPAATSGVCCPKCGATENKSPSFTFWGGAIGHRILNHVYCQGCGAGYNSKTGQSNLAAIIIYQVVILAVVGIIILVINAK